MKRFSTKIKFTNKQLYLLYEIYCNENIKPDTLMGISKQLERKFYTTNTYSFILKLVDLSILILFKGTNEYLKIVNGKKVSNGRTFPTFIFDKNKFENMWSQTIEYKLSKEAIMRMYPLSMPFINV